jgi:hypothetical protein
MVQPADISSPERVPEIQNSGEKCHGKAYLTKQAHCFE